MTRPLRKERRCVAFVSMESGRWTAGTHYLQNLFAALRSLDADEQVEIALIAPTIDIPEGFKPYVDRVLVTAGLQTWPGFWERQWHRTKRRLGIEPEPRSALSAFLRDQGVDVLFSDTEYGPRFDVPLLSWIPDFQHRHLPEMFSTTELENRDRQFLRMARFASRIVLSSQNAFQDLKTFAPASISKARVLPFVAQIPRQVYDSDPEWVCDKYHLPRKFIYLPNQFWKHKNHGVVIDALCKVKKEGVEVAVVCTGNTNDARHPLYFAQLMAQIAEHGLRDRLIILGLAPRDHTFALMRQSLAVLQPSLFEGWSTTVEEAKSLGKSVVLSDLPVHHEQDPPGAIYFDPLDPVGLAECLIQVFAQKQPGPELALEASARTCLSARAKQMGKAFSSIVSDLAIPLADERPTARL